MQESRFLCLAVSRRDGGSCIAGIDIDTGKWIRPVNSKTHGALGDHEIVVRDGGTQKLRMMTPLDVLQIALDKYAGDNAQPENWELVSPSNGEQYNVLRRLDRREDQDELTSYLEQSGPLLHSYNDSVPASDVVARKLTTSLALIRPEKLHWRVNPKSKFPKELQIRAEFLFDHDSYSLVLTDPIWESKCRRYGQGRHSHLAIAGNANEGVLLTISLAGVSLYGYHYKLAAGVIQLPA
jgi:hypothetical protein